MLARSGSISRFLSSGSVKSATSCELKYGFKEEKRFVVVVRPFIKSTSTEEPHHGSFCL